MFQRILFHCLFIFAFFIGFSNESVKLFKLPIAIQTNISGLDLKQELNRIGFKDLMFELVSDTEAHYLTIKINTNSTGVDCEILDSTQQIYVTSYTPWKINDGGPIVSARFLLSKHGWQIKAAMINWFDSRVEMLFSNYLDSKSQIHSPEGIWIDQDGQKYLCFEKLNPNSPYRQLYWLSILDGNYNAYKLNQTIEVLRTGVYQFSLSSSINKEVVVPESADFFTITYSSGYGAYSYTSKRAYIRVMPTSTSNENGSVQDQIVKSSGTGFLINASGIMATNYHVVDKAASIKVSLNGRDYDAIVYKKDETNDLALIQLIGFETVKDFILFSSTNYNIAEPVYTIGYPRSSILGTDIKYTEGSITSISGIKDEQSQMQHSVPIQPGNSGGPLINSKGEIIGVICSTLNPFLDISKSGGSIPQNVNYAIKSDYLNILAKGLTPAPPATSRMAKLSRTEQVEIMKQYVGLIKVF